MEFETENHEKVCFWVLGYLWIKSLLRKFFVQVVEITKEARKIAKDDPRKVIHSLKVGLALSLVSLFYYLQPLYNNFGASTMWAIMTVVVVFEFSVGATLGKGLNRGLATMVGGALGVGAHHLASISGKTGEPILITIFVFLQVVPSTFARFFPRVKNRYDYGMLIFMLTFCLVSISGYRTNDLIKLAHHRLCTVLIGASTCLVVSYFICPVWAGEDLHNLVAQNLDNLGNLLQGFADDFLNASEAKEPEKDVLFRVRINSILDSKNKEETLSNFATWEPSHGQFMYHHPWKQYLKIGNLIRQCACHIEALNAQVRKEKTDPTIQEAFSRMSLESGKALKEAALAIQTMTMPSSPNLHTTNLKMELTNLKQVLKLDFCENTNLLQIIPVAAIASLLIEIAKNVENIVDAVNELSFVANFRGRNANGVGEDESCHVISINEPTLANLEGQCGVQPSSQKLTL